MTKDYNQKAYGFIHCHSDHSIKDSPLKIERLVKGACDMGAKAVTLTDHGTCTGIFEFMNLCHENHIKPIPGVEAYVKSEYSQRSHLVLLAKNYRGYQKIARAVTLSNRHIEEMGDISYPVMNKEIIQKCLSGGDVIATSACVGGVLASILLINQKLDVQISKLKKKLSRYSNPDDKAYVANMKKIQELSEKIESLTSERDILSALAGKSYKKRLKGLEILRNEKDIYEETKEILDREMEESRKAKERLPAIKQEIASLRKLKSAISGKCSLARKTHNRYIEVSQKIQELENKRLSREQAIARVSQEIEWYQSVFHDDFYMEMQYHGLDSEAYVMPILRNLAEKYNVPLVAANDIHILKKEDAPTRQFVRSLRYSKYEEISDADRELHMKDDRELHDALIQILPESSVREAILNIRVICDSCNVVIPETSHYPKYRDENGNEPEDAAELLRQKTLEGIRDRFPDNTFDKIYKERLEYELNVIISLGFADYLLIVADYISYAKQLGKDLGNGVGYAVGPGRGSGAGSLVNYLLGITVVDPLKYNLKFERFLNKDRVSMPDIDVDFSEEVRGRTIEYVSQKYGNDSVAAIRTLITQGPKLAVKNAARFYGWQEVQGLSRTSEAYKQKMKPYRNLGDKISGSVEGKFKDCIHDISHQFHDEMSQKIIQTAVLSDGVATGYGVHAAGIIIGDGQPLSEYVPLMYNTKKEQWAVQCDMAEAEASVHLLKMDFLGLNNLDILTESIRRVKKNTGISIDLNNLPFEEEIFREIFSKGNTGCVFQFESGGMKEMLRKFQPECFEDIVLLVAAYRPGPMDSIPAIIKAKQGKTVPQYIIPQLKEILDPTYGQPIYQEQLMDIFHKCAGFTVGEADIIRKYMSKKKEELFLGYKDKFIEGIIHSGADEEDAAAFWDSLVNFAKYAFNKSHAVVYGLISYQTAYMKYHYPAEYMCAVINRAKIEKLPAYLYECRQMGIPIMAPDINHSLMNFEEDGHSIIYGLSPIKGVSSQAAEIIKDRKQNGFYQSFHDFILRTSADIGIIRSLIKVGCFDSLEGCKRKALYDSVDYLLKDAKIIRNKKKAILELEEKSKSPVSAKDRKSIKRRIENANLAMEKAYADMKENSAENAKEDDKYDVLADEKELLGAYVTGHPLDSYAHLFQSGRVRLIDDFKTGYNWYAGMINDLRLAKRKSDGAEMAFFTLEDTTGTIQVSCFANAYASFKDIITEGAVIEIYARGEEEKSYYDENEVVHKLTLQKAKKTRKRRKPILLSFADEEIYRCQVLPIIIKHNEKDGRQVIIHNASDGNIETTQYFVSDELLDEKIEKAYAQIINA